MSTIEVSEKAYFDSELLSFQDSLRLALRFSSASGNRFFKVRFGWASRLLMRVCSIGLSINTLVERANEGTGNFTLDHSTICSLSRDALEASIMFLYLSERGLTDEQWTLRRNILWLHDATSRYRFLKGITPDFDAIAGKTVLEELKSRLTKLSLFSKLDKDRQKKILDGGEMYVNGLRGAVRLLDMDMKQFDGIYVYLSQHGHSAPVSFLRMDDHEVNLRRPGGAQLALSGFALEIARSAFTACSRRQAELLPDAINDHGFEELELDLESPESPFPENDPEDGKEV